MHDRRTGGLWLVCVCGCVFVCVCVKQQSRDEGLWVRSDTVELWSTCHDLSRT